MTAIPYLDEMWSITSGCGDDMVSAGCGTWDNYPTGGPSLDWVVCGPGTGPGRRHFDPQWAVDVREQCLAAGAPYYDKRQSHKHWRELPWVTP